MAKEKWHGFVSDEEYYYHEWLLELKELGYIDKIVLQPTYNIMPAQTVKNDQGKVLTVMKKWDYTADFEIHWAPKALDTNLIIDYNCLNELASFELGIRGKHVVQDYLYRMSIIDVKSDFARSARASDVRFPLNQKAMYGLFGIYVQKSMPLSKKRNGLFKNTFTPKAYLKTRTGKDRKIHWEIKTVEDYVQTLGKTGS